MRLSKFTLFLSIYIIASSIFMQQVWTAWKAIFGINLLILSFVILCLAAISAILYQNIKSGFNIKRIGLISAICIGGFIFAWRQPYLPEKAHVLEFGLLGWLAIRDLTKYNRYLPKNLVVAFVFIAIIGILEEGFQKLLPWRVCEIRDMLTDTISGALGIILFVISNLKTRKV